MIYMELFLTFLKIGAFTFGGGYAMLPLIQQEVINSGWLSEEQLIDFVAISESTPGPFAVNISTFVGAQTAGIIGALCATTGVVLPSFIIILFVAKAYERFCSSKIIKDAMIGLKGTVVGLIGAAVISTAKSIFVVSNFGNKEAAGLGLFIVILYLLLKKKVNPIIVILGSAVAGIVMCGILKL